MISALISDLGNVLLHFDHRIIAARMGHDFPHVAWNAEGEKEFWKLVGDFEKGAVDSAYFLSETGRLLGEEHPLEEQHFRTLWGDIFWLNTEYLALLEQLSADLTLVLLSNTNPLHIDYARERFPEVFSVFKETVYSYDIGASKPDERMFGEALRAAGAAPEETLYFDDIAAYVDAASRLGMHAYQYVSVRGVRDVLAMYDVPAVLDLH